MNITKTIGIIGAMPSELKDIRAGLPDSEIQHKAGFDYYINQIGCIRVVHVCSGIAKVNAAVCAQTMIDTFAPAAILNAGVAGGMHPDVHLCDIVISTEVLPHDLDLHFLQDYPPYCAIYPSDKTLISYAQKACNKLDYRNFTGRIVSGETFVSDNAIKAEIEQRLHPYAADMESSAVGHCAYLNQVPFVSIRCISDNADDAGEMSFDQFELIAAKRVANVVLQLVQDLS